MCRLHGLAGADCTDHGCARVGRLYLGRCRNRRCSSCGILWAGDTRRKLLTNIEAQDGDVALVTVTAPGTWALPWDEEHCAHRGPHHHSGKTGCRVLPQAARQWNQGIARPEWTRMHRKAAQRAHRRAKAVGKTWRIVAREWEFQARGVLHMHVVVPMATPTDRICSQVYAEALAEMSERHGFGFVDRGSKQLQATGSPHARLLERIPQQLAARYLAKYIAAVDPAGGKITLSETVRHPDVPGHVTYVSRHLTRRTGCTMRTLRERRCTHWQARRTLDGLGGGMARIVLAQNRDALLCEFGAYFVSELERMLGP